MPGVRYRFGPFELSPARRSLRQAGEDVPLIPRYFDLLLLLVTERHRVVTRQEIFDRVWSGVVVSDGALTQAIRTLRRALGDGTRESRFIRTVSRYGYQFVAADVIEDVDEPTAPAPEPSPDLTASRQNVVPQATVTASGPGGTQRFFLAALGGAVAGLLAGSLGGCLLWALAGSHARADMIPALAMVGLVAGVIGAAGIGTGILAAEAWRLPARALSLLCGGAAGGLAAGWLAHALSRAFIASMFGRDVLGVGGALEGCGLGAAAGLGYAWAARGLAGDDVSLSPGRGRLVLVMALACGLATWLLSLAGGAFVSTSLDALASRFDGSAVGMGPLAALLGDATLGSFTKTTLSAFEGVAFGAGLGAGLVPRDREAR